MEKQIILFDWDDTLFSKAEYLQRLNSNLARECNTSIEQIIESQEKYFKSLGDSNDFHIEKNIEYLGQNFNKKIDLENFTTDRFEIYSKALFADSIPALEKLKNNFRLGIYSQGFNDCQKIKINASGIGHYFEEELIFIARNKSDPKFIETLPGGAIIIDDKQSKIEPLETTGRFDLFWLNRNGNEIMSGKAKTTGNLIQFAEFVIARAA